MGKAKGTLEKGDSLKHGIGVDLQGMIAQVEGKREWVEAFIYPLRGKVEILARQFFEELKSLPTLDLSKSLYTIAQLTLLASACCGYAITLLICIGGFPKLAVVTALLSSTNVVGAYIAHEAKIQQSLAESADRFEKQNALLEKHVAALGEINIELKATSAALKETHAELKEQVSLFTEQNVELRAHIDDLGAANAELHSEILLLKQEVRSLAALNVELKQTSRALSEETTFLAAQHQQWREFATMYQEGVAELSSAQQAHSHTEQLLLQRFTEQILTSETLWKGLFQEIQRNCHSHATLIAEHTRALAGLKGQELRDALKRDIFEATAELRGLNQHLEILKREHQTILTAHQELLRAHQEISAELKAHVQELKSSALHPAQS